MISPSVLLTIVATVCVFLFSPLIIVAATGHPISRNLALTIIFIACIVGPALAIAATGFSSIGALGRNPSSAPKILTAMTINLIFAESIAIVAFLVVWQLFTPK